MSLRNLDNGVSGSVEVIDNSDIHFTLVSFSESAHDLIGFFIIGALQTHNDGDFESHVFSSSDYSICDQAAVDNSSENVHKDSFYGRVGLKDFESSLYLSGTGTTSNIEEVSRAASLKTNDVHS
jgi:hypothetical protein